MDDSVRSHEAAGEFPGQGGPHPGARSVEIAQRIAALRAAARRATRPDPPTARDVPQPASDAAIAGTAARIAHLRTVRKRPAYDASIHRLVLSTQQRAADVHRRLGAMIELWEAHIPADLAAKTALTSLRGGVLHVTVDSSPVAYELDRLLRGGMLIEMRRAFRGSLTRVKLHIAGERS